MRDYGQMFEEWEADPEYWLRLSALEFVESLQLILDSNKIKRKELARRAGVAEPVVSKALRGDANLKLKTMNKLAAAVGAVVHIHVERREVDGSWEPFEEPPRALDGLRRSSGATEPSESASEASATDLQKAAFGYNPLPATFRVKAA